MTLLSIESVRYAYPQNPVLKDISLHVGEHEFVSILGSSGVGKTTLFNLIAGILPLQEGQILIEGSPDLAGKVSYMLQKDLLLEHKTVLGNVMLPLILQHLPRQQAIAEAEQALRHFQLIAYRDYYPAELSGGMRQRIALIRTCLFRQKLFLLDEAFSALDAITKIQLHSWYKRVMQQYGFTSLLITHDIEEAISMSDRIYLIKNKPGEIVAELSIHLPGEGDPGYDSALLSYKRGILDILDAANPALR